MKEQFQTRIERTDIGNFSGWENLFRVLGLRCCHSLFHEMGLPATIISNSEGIVKASHSFWQMRLQGITWKGRLIGHGYSDPDFPDNYKQGMLSLLNSTFDVITKSYDESDVQKLFDWSQRHFLDKKMIDCWYTWSIILPGMCDTPKKVSTVSVHQEAIMEMVNKCFGVNAEKHIRAALLKARKIPLSSFEQIMVRMEVTNPSDIPEVDVLEIAEQVIRNQCAYRFWSEIRKWIGAFEEEALLKWAGERAIDLDIPIEDIVPPKKEN